MSQAFPNIKIRPHGLQFVAGNIGGLVSAVLILLLAGYDGLLPKSIFPFMMAAFGLLFINLLCKCVYLLRWNDSLMLCPNTMVEQSKAITDIIDFLVSMVQS